MGDKENNQITQERLLLIMRLGIELGLRLTEIPDFSGLLMGETPRTSSPTNRRETTKCDSVSGQPHAASGTTPTCNEKGNRHDLRP